MSDLPQRQMQPVTIESALDNAARLLSEAELEGLTNLPRMERLEKLADSWVNIAAWLIQREKG